MRKKIFISLVVLLTFISARNLKYLYGYVVFGKEQWNELDEVYTTNLLVYSQILLVLLVCYFLFKNKVLEHLGMHKDMFHGFKIGLLCSLPMLIGYTIMNGYIIKIDLSIIHRALALAGFFEEFLFRGFLFGILFYYARWGFIPAVILPSIFFGLGHLYQAENMNEIISVFLFTALASAGFAWFYTAWKNLWVVIFLHGFMDLAWDMAQIDTNVTGNLMVNIFRFASLGLMIFLSLRNLKKHPLNSIKGSLWIQKC